MNLCGDGDRLSTFYEINFLDEIVWRIFNSVQSSGGQPLYHQGPEKGVADITFSTKTKKQCYFLATF